MIHVKVCGVTSGRDIAGAAVGGADLVGIWWEVNAAADRTDEQVAELGRHARALAVDPVLVTFSHDTARLARLLRAARIRWVQLHAYQPPSVVAALRAAVPAPFTVVKVLHLNGERCAETPLIPAYQRAGVDMFLIDTASGRRIGSTGVRADPDAVDRLAARVELPFLLAGGIRAGSDRPPAARRAGFAGIDVDSHARDEERRPDPRRVAALVRTARIWASPGRSTAADDSAGAVHSAGPMVGGRA